MAIVLTLGWSSPTLHAHGDIGSGAPCAGHAAPLLDDALPADRGHGETTCALACCTVCSLAMTLPAMPSLAHVSRHRQHPQGHQSERSRRPAALLRPPRH